MNKIYSHCAQNIEYFVTTEVPSIDFEFVNQVHGNIVADIDEIKKDNPPLADGIIISNDSPKNACIKTADCLPIVLIGNKSSAIIHAGWKGLQNCILNNKRIEKHQISTVIIGPHIRVCCFEVTSEFKTYFKLENFHKRDSKLYFDLTQEAKDQIKLYYPNASIVDSQLCTSCNKTLHSYRRNKTTNRNYNIVTNRLVKNE